MRFRLLSSRRSTFAFILGLTLALPVQALDDVLDTPAMPSALAARTLLLDVVRAGDRLVAVGQRGHVVYSDDDGQTWQQAQVPVSTTLTAVHFPRPDLGWAVGHSGVILHSSDGGQTWVKQFDGVAANEMVIRQREELVESLRAKLERARASEADDLQAQLEEAEMGLDDAHADAEVGPDKPFLDVFFLDGRRGFAVGAYGYFFATRDGGKSWQNFGGRLENPDRLHLNAISQVTGGAMFVVGETGIIFRSTDEGETWLQIESPYEGSLFGVSGTGNVNEVMVLGLRGHMFRSEDLGKNWEQVDAGVEATLNFATSATGGRMVVVGNSGLVLTSRNYGQSFDATVREDRLSLAGAAWLPTGELLVVGEDGAKRTDASGRTLK